MRSARLSAVLACACIVRLVDAAHAVTTAGVRLAYQVSGTPGAPQMVLLHTLGERGARWAPGRGHIGRALHGWHDGVPGRHGAAGPGRAADCELRRPFPRDRPIADRPAGPLDFDWAVVPAVMGQVKSHLAARDSPGRDHRADAADRRSAPHPAGQARRGGCPHPASRPGKLSFPAGYLFPQGF